MVRPRQSLNIHVDWVEVLSALQLPLGSRALPCRTRCPLCGKDSLHIYNDTIGGGQWHACDSCNSTGDMIELAAKTWEMDITATLVKLRHLSILGSLPIEFSDAVVAYNEQQIGYRQRVAGLWKEAREYLPVAREPFRQMQHKFRLRINMSRDRWCDGPGHLMGALPAKSIERWLTPNLVNNHSRNPGHDRVFKGGRWEDVLIVPFYDLPNRMRALQFMGRGGKLTDRIYRRLSVGYGTESDFREGGLAGVPSLARSGDTRAVIAVDDWLMSLQLQLRQFNTSTRPLPMVAWMDNGKHRTRHAWNMLRDRRIIFWTFEMNHRLLMQAVHADAEIAMTPLSNPTPKQRDHWIRDNRADRLMVRMLDLGVGWPKALKQWLDTTDDGRAEQLLLRLEEAGEDVSYILKRAGTSARTIDIPKSFREVRIDNVMVVEQGDAWYRKDSKGRMEMISDAPIHLQHAIKDRRTGEVFIRGVIRYKGFDVHFIEPASRFDTSKHMVSWIREVVTEHNLGLPFAAPPHWRTKLYLIANKFHEPEFVVGDLSDWVKKLPVPRYQPVQASVH